MNRPWSALFASRLFLPVLLACLAAAMLPAPAANATPNNIVISQVYGGGGTTYPYDFIELHNRGTVSVDVTGWSVQYANATSTNWLGTILSGSIPAGGYYLVREAFGGAAPTPLPTPNALGSVPMDPFAGKVALVDTTLALFGLDPPRTRIVDLLGYGATATAYEGAPMAGLLPTTAGLRGNAGCTDTDNNNADFAASAPNPRNSGTPLYRCPLSLTYLAGPNGHITGSSTQSVPYGGDGTEVEAVGETGYHFDQWDDAFPTANRTDMNVLDNVTATATFAINQYTLKYGAASHGSITGTLEQTVTHGGSGTEVEAVAAAGYHFDNWSDGYPTAKRTDTNVTGDIDVTANFAADVFTLKYTAGANGTITGDLDQSVPFGGDGTEVEAVAAAGYHFDNWSDGYPTAKRTDTNVTGDIDVTASFTKDSYTLAVTIDPPGSGNVIRSIELTEYPAGTEVVLTPVRCGLSGPCALADSTDYHFDHWTGTVNNGARPLTVTMNSNVTLTAHFVPNALAGQVVISQVFGDAGPGRLSHDYVELYNRGNGPVSVAGWSIQSTATSGTVWSSTNIAGIMQPGHYLLIRLAGTNPPSAGTLSLPDVIGATMDLGASHGKVALVGNTTPLDVECPSGIGIVDLFGYGTIDCSEDQPMGALLGSKAAFRGNGGCDETDHNQVDFASGDPSPRNSLSPAHNCLPLWLSVDPRPSELSLSLVGANPTGGRARFSLGLPQDGRVRASVSDIQGRRVASIVDEYLSAGRHDLSWDGTSENGAVRAGFYYLTVQAMGQRLIRSFVLVR